MKSFKEERDDVREKRAATSMKQSAEWSIRGFQASFPKMKDCADNKKHCER